MKRIIVLVLLGVLLLSLGTLACAETKYSEGNEKAATGDIEILTHSGAYEPVNVYDTNPAYYVRGTAKNVSGKQLSYAEIRVRAYDSAGNLLESGLDNINDIGADQTWTFEVFVWKQGIASYDIGVGSTF